MNNNIRKSSLTHEVINEIINIIYNTPIKEGERLPSERKLCETLNVSRSTLRSAIKHLAYNQIIKIKPGSGHFVTQEADYLRKQSKQVSQYKKLSLSDIQEFKNRMEIRIIIEPKIARIATTSATNQEIKKLQEIVNRMESYVEESSGVYYQEDNNFHLFLAQITGNNHFVEIVQNYCVQVEHHLFAFGSIPDWEKESLKQHKKILYAIQNREEKEAESAMFEHINESLIKNAEYVYRSDININKTLLNHSIKNTED